MLCGFYVSLLRSSIYNLFSALLLLLTYRSYGAILAFGTLLFRFNLRFGKSSINFKQYKSATQEKPHKELNARLKKNIKLILFTSLTLHTFRVDNRRS